MLRWVLAFLVLTLLAGLLGFGGFASGVAWLGKALFVFFLILLILSVIRAAGPSEAASS